MPLSIIQVSISSQQNNICTFVCISF